MSYAEAKARYAAIGVDTEAAIARLKTVPISLHCWQGDGDSFQSGNGGFGVHANGSVAGFCFCVTHRVPPSEMLIWIFKLPMAVASMGRATTCFPV